MAKTQKKLKTRKTKGDIKMKKQMKKKLLRTPYQTHISSVRKNKKIKFDHQEKSDKYIIKLQNIFVLLFNYFSSNSLLSNNSWNKLDKIIQNADEILFANYGNLLDSEHFYRCFISYLKKSIKTIKPIYYYSLFSAFKKLKNEDLKSFLFFESISSYIRQDIILSIFDCNENIDIYINMLDMDDNWYFPINKNNLIIDESMEEFRENYLYSKNVFNSIKLTLSQYVKVDEITIKNTIKSVLEKTNFYYSYTNEQFSAFTFLGYNVVIRKYFSDFKTDKIKISLRNVITHELIHILIIELTDKNFFNRSYEKSNYKFKESGDYFERTFFGLEINYFSPELIAYLENFDNLDKNHDDFKKEIQIIYNNTCSKKESKIMSLTDSECIQKGIVRTKFNFKHNFDYKEFGHCSRHFLKKEKIE